MTRALMIALAIALCLPGLAATGGSWSASTAKQFSVGTLDGTALDDEGRLRLAPRRDTMWGPEAGVVWEIVADDGDGAFAALSSPGRVLHLNAQGDAEVWFEAEGETLVGALASDGAGGVYAGLSPGGEIVHVTAPGESELVVETGALFVWSLETAADGSLWIGTGMPGMLQHRGTDGEVRTLFESGDDPMRCMAPLEDGGVLVGTGGRGRVIRFDETGRPFVLYDADEPEIVDLVLGEPGEVWLLAAQASKQVRAAQAASAQAQETVRVVASAPGGNGGEGGNGKEGGSGSKPPSKSAPPRPSAPGGAIVYRLTEDGSARVVWRSAKEMPFGLARGAEGELLVATGDLGRIFRLDGRGGASMLLEIPSDQASAIATGRDGRSVWVGGTSDARIERFETAPRKAGIYLTPAIDAGSVARWGRLTWEADLPQGTGIEVSVRAGNSSEPDTTWSDWVSLDARNGEGLAKGLPPSRRLQARVKMSRSRGGESPLLRTFEVFFLARNRPPAIRSLAVQPAGVVWSATQAQSSRPRGPLVADDPVSRKAVASLSGRKVQPVRKSFELGARTASWEAEDPDGDRLTYRVEIRREGTESWLPLRDRIERRYFVWDTRSFPDGLYRVRLTVADRVDNPEGEEFSDMRVSPAFRVDNTRPSVESARIRPDEDGFEVEFVASDPGGNVAAVEVAVDGGSWEPLDPVDGVADSSEERYQTRVEAQEEGARSTRSIQVRVTDSSGNLGGDAWPLGESERP